MLIRTDRDRERETETEIRRGGHYQRQIRTKGQRVTATERDVLQMETQRETSSKRRALGNSRGRGSRRLGREKATEKEGLEEGG